MLSLSAGISHRSTIVSNGQYKSLERLLRL